MKYLKLYIFLLLILFKPSPSYTQETYEWNLIQNDSLFQMYKYDFLHPEAGGDLLFEIHQKRFTNPNMRGYSNTIISFEFNKERTVVYFLEEEGDLYQYLISSDELLYLNDVTPDNSPNSINFLQRTYTLSQVNDSIFYCTGDASVEYNINTNSSVIYRRIPSIPLINTPFEASLNLYNLFKYKDTLLGITRDYSIVYPNIKSPVDRVTWFLPDEITTHPIEMVAYHYDCDSVALFYWKYDVDVSEYVYHEIDTFGTFRGIQKLRRGAQIPGKNTIGRIKNYPGFDYKAACLRLVNLDEDESTVPGPDYKIDQLCKIENIPLGDADTRVSHSSVVDSVVISFTDPAIPCLFNAFQGNYTLINRGHSLVFLKRSNTKNMDYSAGIIQSTCTCNNLSPGQAVHYSVTAWYQGSPGNPAWGTLQLSDTVPYAGMDIENTFCLDKDSLIHIPGLLDVEASAGGTFMENGINLNADFVTLSPGQSMEFVYVVGQQTCPDTAQVTIIAYSFPETADIADIIACHDQPAEVDVSFLAGDIQWQDGFSGVYRILSLPGQYAYTVTGIGGCRSSDSFNVVVLPAPRLQQVELTACRGTSFAYESQLFDDEGTDTLRVENRLGCDSVITIISRRFFPLVAPAWDGPEGLCPGESDTLSVFSPLQELTINDQPAAAESLIHSPGLYTINGTDQNGCSVTWNVEVEAYEAPGVTLASMADTFWMMDLTPAVDFSGDIITYAWSPPEFFDCPACPFPRILPGSNGAFSVEVINNTGCRSFATSYLSFFEEDIVLPNVISIHSTRFQNNSFYLQTKHDLLYDLTIYDRWGNVHFDHKNIISNDPGVGWQPDPGLVRGVYVYVIRVYAWNETKIYSGDITLMD